MCAARVARRLVHCRGMLQQAVSPSLLASGAAGEPQRVATRPGGPRAPRPWDGAPARRRPRPLAALLLHPSAAGAAAASDRLAPARRWHSSAPSRPGAPRDGGLRLGVALTGAAGAVCLATPGSKAEGAEPGPRPPPPPAAPHEAQHNPVLFRPPAPGAGASPASASASTPSPDPRVSKPASGHEAREHLESTRFLRRLLHSPSVTVVDSTDVVGGLPLSLHDHLFEALKRGGQIRSYTCMYDYGVAGSGSGSGGGDRYFAVYRLGVQVCGFPGIVHGGLSAAMCDEAFGGLLQGLKLDGTLPPGPAYTVHLSMQYKNMVPSDSTVVVSAALESVEDDGRKVWMRCTLSDARGPQEGTVYATSRALFVHPRPGQAVQALGKLVKSRLGM